MERMRVLSLCTGIGGIDLAAEATGLMEIVGQVELDEFCTSVLAHHWPTVRRMRDLKEVVGDEWGTIELVVAGFPCQPVSVAGKRRGQADDRWLWPEVHRVIQCARPAWVLLENVPNLVNLGLDIVLSDLASAGYEAAACVYPAAAVGAPHLRERIFIVGHARHTQRAGRDASATRGTGSTGTWQQSCNEPAPHGVNVAHANRQRQLQPQGRISDIRRRVDDGSADVADANISRRRPNERDVQAGQSDTKRCGALADAAGNGWGTRWPESAGQRGQAGSIWSGTSDVEHASSAGREEQHPSRVACDAGHASGRHAAHRRDRQTESRLGGVATGFPSRLDGHPGWPARPGEAQHAYEPPRTVTGRQAHRANRLKALGNAVVPQQVYPILAAIAQTWLAEQDA